MFWEAVIGGFRILTYWQTYVAGVIYIFIIFAPMIIFNIAIKNSEGAGCLSALVQPISQAFATWVFIMILSPILLGISNKAAWTLPWVVLFDNPWFPIKIIGIMILASIGIAFIPIIGQMPSVLTLVSGTISLLPVIGLIDMINPDAGIANISLYPGLWYMGGFLLISGITLRLGMLITATLMSLISHWSMEFVELLAFPLGGLFGFMPLFIYAAWIGCQLKPLINHL